MEACKEQAGVCPGACSGLQTCSTGFHCGLVLVSCAGVCGCFVIVPVKGSRHKGRVEIVRPLDLT